MSEIDDIKSKFDGLFTKDLLASISFFVEGIELYDVSSKVGNPRAHLVFKIAICRILREKNCSREKFLLKRQNYGLSGGIR